MVVFLAKKSCLSLDAQEVARFFSLCKINGCDILIAVEENQGEDLEVY